MLSGDVVVELRDAEAGATHTIRAARLTYNQARRTLAAGGGVAYTLDEGGRAETFEGRSLSLRPRHLGGRVHRRPDQQDRSRGRRRDSPSPSRAPPSPGSAGDRVVLEDGTFTSLRPAWIPTTRSGRGKCGSSPRGNGRCGTRCCTVGRVPVLWMPVFFYPGDRLVFNPSFGFREREGAFVQTTTYLVGRSARKQESLFSFLKVERDEGNRLRPGAARHLPPQAADRAAAGRTATQR